MECEFLFYWLYLNLCDVLIGEISLEIYYIIIGGLCYKYDCFVRGVSKKYDDFWL